MNRSLLSDRLWKDTAKLSVASLYHPFVIQIAQGTLPPTTFKQYLSQDEYFLNAFKKCMILGERKCNRTGKCLRLLKTLKGDHQEEVQLHQGILTDGKKGFVLNAAAKDYTENLLQIAENEAELGYLAASLAPCPVLYKYIGENISAGSKYQSDANFDKDLRKWIETYSVSERDIEPAEELLSYSGSGLAYGKLLHFYKQSLALEYDFFDAYGVGDESCPPFAERFRDRKIDLIVDFDGTMTKFDTCDVIGEGIASLKDGRWKNEARKQWNAIVEKYACEYDKTVADMKNAESLEGSCRILSDFEHEATKMINDSGVLGGIDVEGLRSLGAWVQLHEGCPELIEKTCQAPNANFKVLSANWSSEFLKSVIELNTKADLSAIEVISNDLKLDDRFVTTGVVDGLVCRPEDKEKFVSGSENDGVLKVYVGNSIHDILALLAADVGIILGNNETVRFICDKFGVAVLPLVTCMVDPDCCQNREKKVLFAAENLYEVIAFMYGIKREEIVFSKFPEPSVPKVLVVGGSDSAGCSGLQADIKTCDSCGVFASSAVTSVTVQNTRGVYHIENMDGRSVRLQMMSVLKDLGTDVVKTGMLPTAEIVDGVADVVRKFDLLHLVVDPVFGASTGASLVTDDAKSAVVRKLFPLALIVTPNVIEASAILDDRPIEGLDDMKDAARCIHELGPSWVLVKGGHIRSRSDDLVHDVLYNGTTDEFHVFSNPFVSTRNCRGTGCTLASAIAANLAIGRTMVDAVRSSHSYVYDALLNSSAHALGKGKTGPMRHNFDSCKKLRFEGLRSQLALYFVTDQRMIEDRRSSIAEVVEEAILGGASFVQVRCKDADADSFVAHVQQALKICRKHSVPLVVNDRIDVAMACDADGVHVGQTDLDVRALRRLLGPNKIIGVSASSEREAVQGQLDGADYVGAGTVFATSTKTDTNGLIGLQGLKRIVDSVEIPVVAIGGITSENTPQIMSSGVDGIAVVSAILKGQSVESNSAALRRLVEGGKQPLQNSAEQRVGRFDFDKGVHFLLDLDVADDISKICRKAISSGVSVIVVEGHSQDGGPFCRSVKAVSDICDECDVRLVVKDRLDVALVSGAHGVLLDDWSIDVASARELLGRGRLLGVDVSDVAHALIAQRSGADFIVAPKDVARDVLLRVQIPVVIKGLKFCDDASEMKISSGVGGFLISADILQEVDSSNFIADLKL